jgi:hypothetical protein
LEAQAGHLSKRMSDYYKHIREKAARKASDALSRVKGEQRAAVRAKMQEHVLTDFEAIPSTTDAGTGQSAVVH